MKKNKKGFTLIEILIIVCIIGILVSVIMVGLMNAKKKSQDVSALTTFKSIASPAFMCLNSGIATVDLRNNPIAGNNICNSAIPTPNSVWPDFSKYGWTNALAGGTNSFYWCNVNATGSALPATMSTTYTSGSVGGSRSTGDFCFMIRNGTKYMWCTLKGCYKQGF